MVDTTLPRLALGPIGSTVSLASLLDNSFGGVSHFSSVWVYSFWSQSYLASIDFSYWDPSHPSLSQWITKDVVVPTYSFTPIATVDLASTYLQIGNSIVATTLIALGSKATSDTPTTWSYYTVDALSSSAVPMPSVKAPDPADVVAAAQKIAAYATQVPNDNDCHNIASAVAAAAGASLPLNSGSISPDENEDGGFWRVVYRGSDPGTVSHWQSLVQPGDIVRMQWLPQYGDRHTTLILSKTSDSKIMVLDNAGGVISIHEDGYDKYTNAQSITIYRLSPDHLYLMAGSDSSDALVGTVFDDELRGLAGNDVLYGGPGSDHLMGGSGSDVLVGESGADHFVFDASALGGYYSRDEVRDFNRGNTGFYQATEGDTLDLSALLATYSHPLTHDVRLVENTSGAYADLQALIDVGSGLHWENIARIGGSHQAERATIALDPSATTITLGFEANVGKTGDMNGDGKSDLLWQRDDGSMDSWSLSSTTIIGGGSLSYIPATTWHVNAMADFDNDGKSDILWRNDNGSLSWWMMNGTAVKATTGLTYAPDAHWQVAGVADFDGDHKDDVLWRHENGSLAMWKIDSGYVTTSWAVSQMGSSSTHVVGVADANADGKADILMQADSGQLEVWTMNGSTVSSRTAVGYTPPSAWHVVGYADFSGDHKADILFRHDNGSLALWTMNGASLVSALSVQGVSDPSWKVAGLGDFNGDSRTDIIWRNDSNGTMAEWQMDGGQIIGGGSVAAADPSYKVMLHHYDFL